jgi:hypothetical protein
VAGTVVLLHNKALLQTQGSIDLNLLDVVVLEGGFLFSADESGLLVYLQGGSRIGPEATPWIASDVEAFLRIDASGVVSKVLLDTNPIRIGNAVEITPQTLVLIINTTGKDVSFTIPQEFRRSGGPESITVSGTPPGASAAAGYVSASGGGLVRLTDAFVLTGNFDLLLKTDVSTFVFNATLDLPVLAPLTVAGSLAYVSGANGGLFGSLGVAAANGASLIDVAGVLRLDASMLLEVNTTSLEREVRSIRRAGEADPDGDGYVLRVVAANTLRIAGIGQLAVGGTSFNGYTVLTFDSGRIRVDLAGMADVGFGSLAVAGEAWILHGEDRETDFVFAGRASGRIGDISGIDGAVFINTGAVDVTMDSGTVVQANTTFDVRLTAGLDLGLFKLDIGGRLFKQADLWELRIDRGTLDFFGAVALTATGFYRSDRAFLIHVNGSLTLSNGLPISGEGRISMSLGRDASGTTTFRGEILGTTRYDFGWLGSGEGPSFRGNLAFGPSSVSFSMQLGPIFGSMWTFGPFVWQRSNPVGGERPDPVLARIQNGVLTLSAGDDPCATVIRTASGMAASSTSPSPSKPSAMPTETPCRDGCAWFPGPSIPDSRRSSPG